MHFLRIPARRSIYLYLSLASLPCWYIILRGASLTLPELRACLFLSGFGMGPLYATSLLILEDLVPVGVRISGWLFAGDTLGIKILAPLVGQFLDETPQVLFLPGGIAGGCILVYLAIDVFRPMIKAELAAEGDGSLTK